MSLKVVPIDMHAKGESFFHPLLKFIGNNMVQPKMPRRYNTLSQTLKY